MQPERLTICALAVLAIGGCTGPETGTPDTCGAADYDNAAGLPADSLALPEDRAYRIIGPDDAVTMDFNPGRLNIVTDDAGRVERLYCG